MIDLAVGNTNISHVPRAADLVPNSIVVSDSLDLLPSLVLKASRDDTTWTEVQYGKMA